MLAGTVKIFFIAYRKLFDVVSNYCAWSILLNSFVGSYKNLLLTVLFIFFFLHNSSLLIENYSTSYQTIVLGLFY